MKQITLTLFLLCLFCIPIYGQQDKNIEEVAELQSLLERASSYQHPSVHLTNEKQALQINEFLVPLAETTLVRWEKDGGKYQVKFFLQKGTAITRTDDLNFRRAYWTVELHDKKACEQFIKLFNRVRSERKS